MGIAVRTVCVSCLQSLEVASGEGVDGPPVCPHCGSELHLSRVGFEAPTDDGPDLSPGFGPPDALTPKIDTSAKLIPGRIGRFVIQEPLGEGGYGQVFRAYDPQLDRDVALKVLKANRLGEKALERFYREARAAARLDHPNIVGLHDAGRDEGRCWIAYQLVPGRTLSLIRDVDRPSVDASVRIIRDLALALDHAHGRGVFHRDLKPANIMVEDSGRPRLTDFGLARRGDVDSDLTREGTVLGTPQYMSPEAAAGRAHEADGRSDVYSLGVILYELLCGRRPADVPSGAPLWRSTRINTPPTPRSVDRAIPTALDRICMKALAFDPVDRYPNARVFADAMSRYLQRRPAARIVDRPARKRGFVIGLTVAAAVLGVTVGLSLYFSTRNPTGVVPGLIVTGPETSLIGPELKTIQPEPNLIAPETTKIARYPVHAVEMSVEDLWRQPVVWIKGSRDHVFHSANGCKYTREAAKADKLKHLGNARTAKQNDYNPCSLCLKPLRQATALPSASP